jgi:TrmH family RNA methyltransferase
MSIRIVQSKQNSRVKELRSALLRPSRQPDTAVAIEGSNLLGEAIRSGLRLETVFVLASAVSTESPQPIAALVTPRSWSWADLASEAALLVILAGIQDPGNLGTILRSAEAFGATGAICLPGTVSQWNSKAVRASAGSVFRLPVLSVSVQDCFAQLKKAGVKTLAAMAHEAKPLGELGLTGSTAFLIGSEGSGLPADLAALADARITIRCPGPVESLNAAVAASVLLYEAAQQRHLRDV